MPLHSFYQGMGVWGMRGFGKTTALFTMLVSLMQQIPSVIVLDYKKDFRSLARLVPGLAVLRWNQFVKPPDFGPVLMRVSVFHA